MTNLVRIRYLSTLLGVLREACKYVDLANATVRPKVPQAQRAAYDAGVVAVKAFCELLQTIDYTGDGMGSN